MSSKILRVSPDETSPDGNSPGQTVAEKPVRDVAVRDETPGDSGDKTGRRDSLRYRLLRRLMLPLLLMLATAEIVTWLFVQRVTHDNYDLNLLDDALNIAQQIKIHDGRAVMELPTTAHRMLQGNNGDTVHYAVVSANGDIIAGDPMLLPLHRASFAKNYVFRDAVLNDQPCRVAVLRDDLENKKFFVVVAETTKNRSHLLARFAIGLLILGGIMIAVTLTIIISGVNSGLKPLQHLRDQIVTRSANDLRPLPESHAARELSVIVYAINALLEKLAASFSEHRRFIANAAHQLRTPLAALTSQIEVELSGTPGDIQATQQKLLKNARRTAHLANQFLSLARLEHTENSGHTREHVDLQDLIRDVVPDFLTVATRKNIDLEFDLEPSIISGSRLLLRELFANILDNAIRYVPQDGSVHVTLKNHLEGVRLIIADNGPGVAVEDLTKLGVPFYRLTTAEPDSSGLGLAIVMEIARLHGAQVSFARGIHGDGLSVNLFFVHEA